MGSLSALLNPLKLSLMRKLLAGTDWKFICMLVSDVEPSTSSKSTYVFRGGDTGFNEPAPVA